MINDARIIDIEQWDTPATTYPLQANISARIKRIKYCKGIYNNYGLNRFDYFHVRKPIPVTYLQLRTGKRWRTWVVDDCPHWWAMEKYARESNGNVLAGGLGLGLVLHALKSNSLVKSITVIEREQAVIDLIQPLLPDFNGQNFQIIKADFGEFCRTTECKFDRAIIDLWVTGSLAETQQVFIQEVLPMFAEIQFKFPGISQVYHGFNLQTKTERRTNESIQV